MKLQLDRSASSLVLLVLCTLGACRSTPPDRSEVLLEADRAFARDVEAHRLAAWVEWFDPHGSQVDPQFRPITGHDAIRRHMAALFGNPAVELLWEPDLARISEGGQLGMTSGRYELVVHHPDGSREVSSGRYFDVWHKQADGSWKVLYDLGDGDVP